MFLMVLMVVCLVSLHLNSFEAIPNLEEVNTISFANSGPQCAFQSHVSGVYGRYDRR